MDPNRVLDIIIESFENHPSMFETYIALLKHYKPDEDTICQIVGFKFQSLASQSVLNESSGSHHTTTSNESLYKITSYLLKHELVDLDALLAHLSPSDAECLQTNKEDMEAARQYAKKLSSIQLGAGGGTGSSGSNVDFSLDKVPSGDSNSSSAGSNAAPQNEISQLIVQYQQYMSHKPKENQRINLLKSLIEIEDYVTALKVIEKMPQWYVASNFEITVAICRALDKNFIDHMYRR